MQTDGRVDKLIVALRNFVHAPTNGKKNAHEVFLRMCQLDFTQI